MVGATGFEPATTGPPVRCATGLRYAPTCSLEFSQKGGGASRRQACAQRAESVAHAAQRVGVRDFAHSQLELLRLRAAGLGDEALARALERQPLVVQQRLDPLHELEVATAIETLAGGILLGAQQL